MSTGLDGVSFVTAVAANEPLPQLFTPPPINPAFGGLMASTSWTEASTDAAQPWLIAGVAFESAKVGNYSGEASCGIWDAGWCGEPGSGSGDGGVKTGVRGDDSPTFYPITTWAYDDCDLRADTRAEVEARVQQVFRMREPVLVARRVCERLLDDAGQAIGVTDLTDAIAELEERFADTNTTGLIHCAPYVLAHLVAQMLVARSGVWWVTPGGHQLVVDGGYAKVLGSNTLIGTSALFGWRGLVTLRDVVDLEHNTYVAIAERSCIVGYEQSIGMVEISGGSL